MKESMNGHTDEWQVERVDKCTHGWMDDWTFRWIGGSTQYMPGWTEGFSNGVVVR